MAKTLRELLSDKDWRMSNLYTIVNKNGESVIFSPNDGQKIIIEKKKELRKKNGNARMIVLKARQLGITTLELISALDDVLFGKNKTKVITAHKQDKQKEMFGKIKYAYEQLPSIVKLGDEERHKPKASIDRQDELYFADNNSKVKVSLDSRSMTPTGLHITELAFREDAQDMMTGTLPSIPKGADITIETTANGVGGYFYDMRQKYSHIDGEYECVFLPWYTDLEYVSDKYVELPDEYKYFDNLGITQAQKNRYALQVQNLGNKVKQEFPTTPEEAFIGTGNTFFYIPIVDTIVPLQGQKTATPGLFVYDESATSLLLGVDTSEGGAMGDYSTISGRNKDGKLLVFYQGRIPPDELCNVIDTIVSTFKKAKHIVIGIERNNTGIATLIRAREFDRYKYLRGEARVDTYTQKKTMKPGWHTNTQTRPLMLSEYEEAIRTQQLVEFDARLKSELYTFVYNEQNKPEAIKGCHDDCIIADAICRQMRKQKPKQEQKDVIRVDWKMR